jgi:hypothetical protein
MFLPSWPMIAALMAIIPVLRSVRSLADPGTYLHVAVGRWIILHHTLPTYDPFSYSIAGAHWVPHEWLAEIVLAAVYDRLGWNGLVILGAACLAVSVILLTRRLLEYLDPLPAMLIVALSWYLLTPHLVARPHLLALPLMVIWCAEVIDARDHRRLPNWWTLPVMTLWANFHGGYMFGLALAAFLGMEAVYDPGLSGRRSTESIRWGTFVLVSAVFSLLTPNFIDGFIQPFRMVTMPTLQAVIVEWKSPNFQILQPLEIWLLSTIFVGFATGFKLPLPRLVLMLGLFHLALQHWRHGDLVAIVVPLSIAASLGPQIAAKIRSDPPTAISRVFAALAAPARGPAVALMIALAFGIGLFVERTPVVRMDSPLTPAAALTAAMRMGLSGPVFNSYGFGGYLIFNGVKTFIDGRIEMYGDAFLKRYVDAARGKEPELSGVLDQYGIAWTMLSPDDGAIWVLDRLPGWRRVYTDDYAVIHVNAGR